MDEDARPLSPRQWDALVALDTAGGETRVKTQRHDRTMPRRLADALQLRGLVHVDGPVVTITDAGRRAAALARRRQP